MNIIFKNIHMENFCGVSIFDSNFSQKTQISGKNRLGKSTIKNAIYWVLYNKMADGSSADGIRPHDKDGKDIDFLEISVSLLINIDGKDILVKKTQKQNWVKDRATLEQKFKGNVNEYEVNGIPKKEKDFTEYIENYIPMSVFSLCTNPMVFLSLDTKKRRAKLCDLLKDFTDSDVIETDTEKFVSLASDLQDGTIDELIARSKKAKTTLEQHLKEIPTRIDEVSKQKVDIDVAELELQKNALNESLNKNLAKQNDVSAQYEELKALNKELMDLQFKKNDLVRVANTEIVSAHRSKENAIYDLQKKLRDFDRELTECADALKYSNYSIERFKEALDKTRADWKATSERVFDDSSLVCSYCGQEYPIEKKEQLKAEFESNKEKEMELIKLAGNDLKSKFDFEKKKVLDIQDRQISIANKIKEVNNEIDSLKAEIAKIPNSVTESDIPECQEIDKKIKENEALFAKNEDAEKLRNELKSEESGIRDEIASVMQKLALSSKNDEIENRIEQLAAEQRETAQKILDEQAMLDKLELFRRTKMQMLSERINQFFDVIKWKMFEEQINGGFADVCIPMVDGTSYDGTLNHGDKILAEIDICRAFQKANNVVAPIMADDTESLDSWRIPNVENQLILLRRTDDERIKVEVI